jgi:hypothetical protein
MWYLSSPIKVVLAPKNTSFRTSTIFIFAPAWLYLVPKTENLIEIVSFWTSWWHSEKHDGSTERTSGQWCMHKISMWVLSRQPHLLKFSDSITEPA